MQTFNPEELGKILKRRQARNELLDQATTKSENLHFVNGLLSLAEQTADRDLLVSVYSALGRRIRSPGPATDLPVLQVLALRAYNALLRVEKKEDRRRKGKLGLSYEVPINSIFKGVRDAYKYSMVLDPVVGRDVLLDCVELHSELVYPFKDQLSPAALISSENIADYMLTWAEHDGFLASVLSLLRKQDQSGLGLFEELVMRLKEIKVNMGRLPRSFSQENVLAVARLVGDHATVYERLFLAFALAETRDFEQVKAMIGNDSAKSVLSGYYSTMAELELAMGKKTDWRKIVETHVQGKDTTVSWILHARGLCAEGREHEACEFLRKKMAGRAAEEQNRLEELKGEYLQLVRRGSPVQQLPIAFPAAPAVLA